MYIEHVRSIKRVENVQDEHINLDLFKIIYNLFMQNKSRDYKSAQTILGGKK